MISDVMPMSRELEDAVHESTIPIAEIFGPTIQGEGLLVGKPTYFVRVGGCDYKCLWCDTDNAVLPELVRKLERKTVSEIITATNDWVQASPGPTWLSISGGNPGLYDLGDLVLSWQHSMPRPFEYDRRVTVETQGSRWRSWFNKVNVLTVSPKPPSSGLSADVSNRTIAAFLDDSTYDEHRAQEYLYDEAMPHDYYNMVLKCIVFDEVDYQFARELHRRYPLIPFYLSTGTAMGGLSGKWVPPAIPDIDTAHDHFRTVRENQSMHWSFETYIEPQWHLLRRYRWLAERAMGDDAMADVAVGMQQHTLLWGINTRGV